MTKPVPAPRTVVEENSNDLPEQATLGYSLSDSYQVYNEAAIAEISYLDDTESPTPKVKTPMTVGMIGLYIAGFFSLLLLLTGHLVSDTFFAAGLMGDAQISDLPAQEQAAIDRIMFMVFLEACGAAAGFIVSLAGVVANHGRRYGVIGIVLALVGSPFMLSMGMVNSIIFRIGQW
jgi:hypothetical protein